MVLGGNYAEWDLEELFWKIDECTDPNSCEYVDFEFKKDGFGIMWPETLEKDENQGIHCFVNIVMSEQFSNIITDVFATSKVWTPINIEITWD